MSTKHMDALESELAELSAHLEIATHRQLTILRELEPTGIWVEQRAKSFAHWLSWRIGLAPGAAREKIRVARALGKLALIDAALARGTISYSKVRAMTRVATAENERVLLDMALGSTAQHLDRICSGMRRADRDQALASDTELRWVRQRASDSGMVRIDAQLHADEAAIVWRAIEQARAARGAAVPLADALVHVARSFDPEGSKSRPIAEVVVHVREEVLAEGTGATAAVLEDGTRVPAETLRRVACDCATRPVVIDGAGIPIDVGRRKRTVTPALRRALAVRDGCCRYPGCADRAWLDAHHVEHWLHGGATEMKNLMLLCSFHHRLVHEGGFSIVSRDRVWVFVDSRGKDVPALPRPLVHPDDAVRALETAHVSAGTRVDDRTLMPDWDGRAPDIRACVSAGLRRSASARLSEPSAASP